MKCVNVKYEHRFDLIRLSMSKYLICTLTDLCTALMSILISIEHKKSFMIHIDRQRLDELVDVLKTVHTFLFCISDRLKQSRTIICLPMIITDQITRDCEHI